MKTSPMLYKFLAITLVVVLLGGCSLSAAPAVPTATATVAPTVNVAPTLDIIRTQAAQTVVAQMTQNAPTATPVTPTSTITETPTVTLTFTPLPPTPRPTATWIPWTATPVNSPTPIGYACSVTDHSPKSTDTIKIGNPFDGNWVVKNTGTQAWDQHNVDFEYISGTKMQTKADLFDLTTTVASGASYTVIVDMTAPATAGTYTATWAIVQYGLTICSLDLSVKVVN